MANAVDFWAAQAARLVPLAAVLGWMVWVRGRTGVAPPQERARQRDRMFLWTVGLTPLALVLLTGLVTRTEIAPRWGHNAFMLAGWLAVDALRWPERRALRALRVCARVHLALWGAAIVVVPTLKQATGWQGRSTLQGQQLAEAAKAAWAARTGQPLRLVISDIWLGGTLVAYNGSALAVLVDGELPRATWVTARDVLECGRDTEPRGCAAAPAWREPLARRLGVAWRMDAVMGTMARARALGHPHHHRLGCDPAAGPKLPVMTR